MKGERAMSGSGKGERTDIAKGNGETGGRRGGQAKRLMEIEELQEDK